MCAGFLLEFVGFAIAAVGLWKTWKANADGRPFFSPRIRRFGNWVWVKLLRRHPRMHVGTARGTTWTTSSASGSGYVSTFTDELTLEEKVQAAQENALRALADAATAQQAASEEKHRRERAVSQLQDQLHGTEEALSAFARELVVDGVPPTVAGVACAVLGLLLQAVASIATFNGVS